MLTIHHLDDSRSQRILWLMEELGLAYEVVHHARDPVTRFAGDELKAVHPLGKAPVLVDDGLVLIESGAIVEHVMARHGGGRMQPADGTAARGRHTEWLHYAEGSAITPFLLMLYASRLGEAAAPIMPRIREQIAAQLGYLEQSLAGRAWLMGGAGPTGADVMMSFVGEIAKATMGLDGLPATAAWVARIQARDAYARALEKGGPYRYA